MTDAPQDRIMKRQLSNFLLKPLLQTKIGLYCIILSLLFTAIIAGLLYVNLAQIFRLIVEMTEAPEEVQTILWNQLSSLQAWVYLSLGIYILAVVTLSIWYTHKLVGPVVAFTRHFEALERGDFTARTILRKHDAFHDAAAALNKATETLEKKAKGTSEKVPL